MQSGLSFEFGDVSDFMLVDAVMDTLFQQKYAAGNIDVQVGATVIGRAGQVTNAQVTAIAKGEKVTFSGQFNDAEYFRLLNEARLVNANIDPTGVKKSVSVLNAPSI